MPLPFEGNVKAFENSKDFCEFTIGLDVDQLTQHGLDVFAL